MKPWMNCLVSSLPPCTSRVIARSTIRSNARHIWPIEFMQWKMRPAPSRSCAAWWPVPVRAELVLDRHAHVVVDDLAVVAGRAAPHADAADDVHARACPSAR